MSSESYQVASSNVTRMSGLDDAKQKSDALLGPANFLTLNTKTRLTSITGTYRLKYDLISVKKHDKVVKTATKEGFGKTCKMVCSHYIQVFNFAIERGVFPVNDRAFYKIDISDATVPELTTDDQIIQVAKDIIKGEADRVAAGGAAMAMPAVADVQLAFNNFNGSLMPQSAAIDAFDLALEDLNAQNHEADAVLKKVFDEVGTFYNEEPAASVREQQREWGYVFAQVGGSKKVTGVVRDSVTNAPIAGAEVSFRNGNKTAVSGADGSFELSTTLMGDQLLDATSDLHDDYSATVTLVENEDLTWDIAMVASV